MDVRPEVRNSAVRTLFAVVAGQGGRMSSATWEECLWQMLFPLLRSVHHLAATSSKEEVPLRTVNLSTNILPVSDCLCNAAATRCVRCWNADCAFCMTQCTIMRPAAHAQQA